MALVFSRSSAVTGPLRGHGRHECDENAHVTPFRRHKRQMTDIADCAPFNRKTQPSNEKQNLKVTISAKL
jgi:hypothetical protein